MVADVFLVLPAGLFSVGSEGSLPSVCGLSSEGLLPSVCGFSSEGILPSL